MGVAEGLRPVHVAIFQLLPIRVIPTKGRSHATLITREFGVAESDKERLILRSTADDGMIRISRRN